MHFDFVGVFFCAHNVKKLQTCKHVSSVDSL